MNEHKLICMSLHKRGRKSYANWVVCWIKLQDRVKERNMYGNTHPTFFSGWTHKCHKSTRINWFTRLSPFSIFRMLDTKYVPTRTNYWLKQTVFLSIIESFYCRTWKVRCYFLRKARWLFGIEMSVVTISWRYVMLWDQ